MRRFRVSLVISIMLVGSIAVLYAIAATILMQSFAQVEQQNTQRDVERVVDVLSETLSSLSRDATDYSSWDETARFVTEKHADYLTDSLNLHALKQNQLNIIAILNPQGQFVYQTVFDLKQEQFDPFPSSLRSHFKSGQILMQFPDLSGDRRGLLYTPEGLLMIASRPILDSDGKGPIQGTLAFGQYLNTEKIAGLSQLTQLDIAIAPTGQTPLPEDFAAVSQILLSQRSPNLSGSELPGSVSHAHKDAAKDTLTHARVVTRPVNDQWMAGYTVLPDLYGKPIAILRVQVARTVYQQGLLSLRYLAISLVVIGVIFGAVIYVLFKKLVQYVRDRDRLEQSLQRSAELQRSEEKYRQKVLELEQILYQLQRTQSQLVQSEKMSSLGQLVAGIAHEINNPVNFIYGNLKHFQDYVQALLTFVQVFQQQNQPQESVKHSLNYHSTKRSPDLSLEQLRSNWQDLRSQAAAIDLDFLANDLPKLTSSMRSGAERIQQIVLSLRNFSRLDESDVKSVDVHEGLENTLLILQNRLKPQGKFPGIEVIKDYGELPAIECYPGQLNQVFINILMNAIDALEESWEQTERAIGTLSTSTYPTHQSFIATPRIYLRTTAQPDDTITIRIADNGSGIPEAIRQKLFDPFFTTKPVGKGTGLGLAVSYQIIVEKHRGQIQCQSIAGQGAEFILQIPVYQGKR